MLYPFSEVQTETSGGEGFAIDVHQTSSQATGPLGEPTFETRVPLDAILVPISINCRTGHVDLGGMCLTAMRCHEYKCVLDSSGSCHIMTHIPFVPRLLVQVYKNQGCGWAGSI